MTHGLSNSVRLCLSVLVCAVSLVVCGCDSDEPDDTAMVMQGQPQPVGVTTRPTDPPAEGAATRPAEEEAAPVYINIDGVPHEFPSARLYLKRSGDRVRAILLSDDPPEALQRDYAGDSFYFEMDMELPTAETRPADPGHVTAEDLAAAEWIFRNDATERADSPSGVFLGGKSHLQPLRVSVWFAPLDEKTVIVTLEGWFADYDKTAPRQAPARREVQVQAVIPADAIRR